MNIPFVGAAYNSRSKAVNTQRCVNLYPEIDQSGKQVMALYPTPGLDLVVGVSGEVRGMHTFNGVTYVVVGNTLFSISGVIATSLGAIAGTNRVSIADNGTQMMIVNGIGGYVYDATNGLQAVTDPDMPVADFVQFQDGYFILNDHGTGKFMVTALYDGSTIDALDFASAEGDPDNLVSIISDHRELWLFGDNTTEIFYNSGAVNFPFERMNGAFIEWGCAAPWTVAKGDNTTFWLAKNKTGEGVVVRANGYTPQIISTRAIEWAIASYATVSDAFGFIYQDNGHTFYVLTFPTGNATWVYDASTNLWHERQSSGGRWLPNAYTFNGSHFVGDVNGNIYTMNDTNYTENGTAIKRIRSTQHLSNDLKNIVVYRLQVDFESGVGLVAGQGNDPQAMLRWSDDGGFTWSNEHWVSMGKLGEYGRRAIWRRLGRSRDRVFELTVTDPVKVVIIGASAEAKVAAT